MPFQSKAQMGAAFGGYLGSEMKKKARQWADETPDIKSLPYHKKAMADQLASIKKKAKKK